MSVCRIVLSFFQISPFSNIQLRERYQNTDTTVIGFHTCSTRSRGSRTLHTPSHPTQVYSHPVSWWYFLPRWLLSAEGRLNGSSACAPPLDCIPAATVSIQCSAPCPWIGSRSETTLPHKGRTVPPPLCYAQQRHLLPAYKQRWRLWQIIVAARQVSPRARRAAAALQASLKAHRKADARSSSIVHRRHARRRQCAQPRSGMWRIARCRRPRAALTTCCCSVVAPSRHRSLARLLANGWASPHG